MAECTEVGRKQAPVHMKVGIPVGAERVAVAAGLAARPDEVTLQQDCENACNEVCRQSMLAAVRAQAPFFLPSAGCVYQQASLLLVPGASAGPTICWPQMCGKGIHVGPSSLL
jgi:hypothetical protein